MAEVVLSLGSNQGARRAQLDRACDMLAQLGEKSLVSSDYRSPAMDFDGGEFINRIMLLDTRRDVFSLLTLLQHLEWSEGRERKGKAYHDRTIDIDIIDYADMNLAWPGLELPHPRAHKRGFVLKPWLDLVGDRPFPGRGQSLLSLLEACPDKHDVTLVPK